MKLWFKQRIIRNLMFMWQWSCRSRSRGICILRKFGRVLKCFPFALFAASEERLCCLTALSLCGNEMSSHIQVSRFWRPNLIPWENASWNQGERGRQKWQSLRSHVLLLFPVTVAVRQNAMSLPEAPDLHLKVLVCCYEKMSSILYVYLLQSFDERIWT